LALGDVLLVHLKKDPVFRMQIPSKITSYLACGQPVLCAVEGEAARLVTESGAGLACPAQDSRAMAQAIRTFYTMPPEDRRVMGDKGRKYFLRNLTKKIQIRRMAGLMEAAAKAGKPGEA
jgi:glycosyltransferase involved in cell wall biosynthesis